MSETEDTSGGRPIGVTRKLVIAPAWVGDMVMAQSLFIALKELDPDTSIDVVAPP
jgi:heptosyltransferase-2